MTEEGFQTKAVVKWFNLTKGFGFVAPENGSPDAFLHSSVLQQIPGMRDIPEGTEIECVIGGGPKGPQVLSISKVLGMSQIHPQQYGGGNAGGGHGGGGGRPPLSGPEEELMGTVKWFKADKGFGFAAPDDGGRDIFIHRSVLLRAGINQLDPGQKIRMKVQAGAKGREATSIEIAF